MRAQQPDVKFTHSPSVDAPAAFAAAHDCGVTVGALVGASVCAHALCAIVIASRTTRGLMMHLVFVCMLQCCAWEYAVARLLDMFPREKRHSATESET